MNPEISSLVNSKTLVHKVKVASYICSQTYNKFIARHNPGIWYELSRDRGQTVNCEGSRQQSKLQNKVMFSFIYNTEKYVNIYLNLYRSYLPKKNNKILLENNKDSYQFHTSH